MCRMIEPVYRDPKLFGRPRAEFARRIEAGGTCDIGVRFYTPYWRTHGNPTRWIRCGNHGLLYFPAYDRFMCSRHNNVGDAAIYDAQFNMPYLDFVEKHCSPYELRRRMGELPPVCIKVRDMTLDEALEAAKWERVTAPHMQHGSYVVWNVASGTYRRVWPNGDGCTFIPHDGDRGATWARMDSGWTTMTATP